MSVPQGQRITTAPAARAHRQARTRAHARRTPRALLRHALVCVCLALWPADARGPRPASASLSTGAHAAHASSAATAHARGADATRNAPTSHSRAASSNHARGGCDERARAALAEGERLRAEWKAESLRAAAGKFEEARACFARARDHAAEADALRRRGDIHYDLTELRRALADYERARRLCRALSDRRCESELQARLAFVFAHLSRNKEAAAAAGAAVALAEGSGDAELEMRALGALGHACYYRGESPEARVQLERARTLARPEHDPNARAQIHLDLGYLRVGEGDAQGALSLMREALALWEAAGHARGRAQAQRAVGLVLGYAGEVGRAIEVQRESLRVAREMGDREGEAVSENNLGFLYERLGRHEDALEMYLHALADYAAVGNASGHAFTSQYVGDCYAALGDERGARANYEAGLAASRRLDDPVLEAYALNNLGVLDQSDGRGRAALSKFRRALATFERVRETRWQAFALVNAGYALETLGDGAGARAAYEQALGLMRSAGDGAGELLARHSLARSLADAGRLEEARAQIENSLGLVELLRAKVIGRELRTSYFATVHRHYELYVDVLMRLSRASASEESAALALRASERSRARALLETLAEVRDGISQGVEPALVERQESLRRRLDAAAWRLAQLRAAGRVAGEIAAAESEWRALVSEQERLKEELRARSPRYAALTEPPPTGLAEIRQLLDDETALVEFSLGERRSYVWGVTRDSFEFAELPPRAEIEGEVRALRELLTAHQRDPQKEDDEDYWRQFRRRAAEADAAYWPRAAAFSRTLLAPVAAALRKKRILLVCDGPLNLIPFDALPKPEGIGSGGWGLEQKDSLHQERGDDGRHDAHAHGVDQSASSPRPPTPDPQPPAPALRPLLLDHEIVNLPSAATLAAIRREAEGRTRPPGAVAVLADPVFERDDPRLARASAPGPEGADDVRVGGAGRAGASPFRAASAGRSARGRVDAPPSVFGEVVRRLPASRAEAEAIMSVVPEGAGLRLLGFEATREAALSPALARYRVVHFATHGIFDERHPERSCVVLSLFDERGGARDGCLGLRDIYNLSLPVELVVLSACRTGLGQEVRGEGLVGLTRGFMYAGSSSVLASLWDVDDEATAELMREFYRGLLRENLTPAEALRAARLSMWRTKHWNAPYYWAAFTLRGEYRVQAQAGGRQASSASSSAWPRAGRRAAIVVAVSAALAAAGALYARGRLRRGRNSRRTA
jgi:tetratricopeptide (TPR) repeat protein